MRAFVKFMNGGFGYCCQIHAHNFSIWQIDKFLFLTFNIYSLLLLLLLNSLASFHWHYTHTHSHSSFNLQHSDFSNCLFAINSTVISTSLCVWIEIWYGIILPERWRDAASVEMCLIFDIYEHDMVGVYYRIVGTFKWLFIWTTNCIHCISWGCIFTKNSTFLVWNVGWKSVSGNWV